MNLHTKDLTPIASAHLAAIVIAFGKHLESIQTKGCDSIDTISTSINVNKARMAFSSDKDITDNEWHKSYGIVRELEQLVANASKAWHDSQRAEKV